MEDKKYQSNSRRDNQTCKSEKVQNFKKVSFLAVLFFLIYVPFNINMNTMSDMLSKDFGSLGFTL